MKKDEKKKLTLKKETVQQLSDEQLGEAAGGTLVLNPTVVQSCTWSSSSITSFATAYTVQQTIAQG
jgi:hypothetical protein